MNVSPLPRPQLLVSVRDVQEACAAIAGGADIIDVKEPAHGPLGAAAPTVVSEIIRTVRNQRLEPQPVSAALGELREFTSPELAYAGVTHPDWLKVGPSGLTHADWQSRWQRLKDELRIRLPDVKLIAVIYADWSTCGAPSPDEILATAYAADVPGVLIDTYEKRGRTLLDFLDLPKLEHLIETIHAAERFVALAGSLRVDHIPELRDLQPDILAVRSAVCLGGRRGPVDANRVAQFRRAMRSPGLHPATLNRD